HIGRAFAAERLLEPLLRRGPGLLARAHPRCARWRQVYLLAAAILLAGASDDQPLALERFYVASERRAIHHHLFGQRIDGHRVDHVCEETAAKNQGVRKPDLEAAMRLFESDKIHVEHYGRPSRPASRLAAGRAEK